MSSEINFQMTFPIIFIPKILTEVYPGKCRSAISNENGARYRFAYDVLDRLIAESGQQTHYFHCDRNRHPKRDETPTEWGIIHSSQKEALIVPVLPDIT